MKKIFLGLFLLNVIFASNPNVVAESDSTKPIALDAVEVLADSKSITTGLFLKMLNLVM